MPPAKNPPPPRPCVICGAAYQPQNARATTCASAECVRQRKRLANVAWYEANRKHHMANVTETRRQRKKRKRKEK